MMKKLFAALFCLSVVTVLSFGVVGCDKKDPPKTGDKKEKEAEKEKKEKEGEKKTT